VVQILNAHVQAREIAIETVMVTIQVDQAAVLELTDRDQATRVVQAVAQRPVQQVPALEMKAQQAQVETRLV